MQLLQNVAFLKKKSTPKIFAPNLPKSSNGRKIARIARILTIFGPNKSQRRDLFFEKRSNERRRHRRVVVAAVVAAVVAIIVVVAGFCGDSITDTPLVSLSDGE